MLKIYWDSCAACCVRQRSGGAKMPHFHVFEALFWNILRADAACCVPTAWLDIPQSSF